jgi:predicted phage tail protein
MALLIKLNNPFDITDKEVTEISCGVAVFYYMNSEKDDIEFVASINGIIIEDYAYILKKEDHLVFIAVPKGGGGGDSNPIATIAMIALVVAAPVLAGGAMGMMAGTGAISAGLFGGLSGALIYGGIQAAIIVGGGLLINTLMPSPQPQGANTSALENISPTYSFSGGSNANVAGSAIPIMLGEARVTPPIIGSYISLAGDN